MMFPLKTIDVGRDGGATSWLPLQTINAPLEVSVDGLSAAVPSAVETTWPSAFTD